MSDRRPVVVVVGGSSGIGKATAIRFAHEGWRVVIASNDANQRAAAAAELSGDGHLALCADIRAPKECDRLQEQIEAAYGTIDTVVNSAGISEQQDALDSEFEDWNRPLEVMLYGSVHVFRALIPIMADGGSILQITSIHYERVMRGVSASAIAKAGVTQWIRSLALELAPRRIRANAIAPGFVKTAMSTNGDGESELETEWFKDNYIRHGHLPLKRAAEPEEIAGVAWFLSGRDASYITGTVLVVDGGLCITY